MYMVKSTTNTRREKNARGISVDIGVYAYTFAWNITDAIEIGLAGIIYSYTREE